MNSHKLTVKCGEENLAKAKIATLLQDLGGKGWGDPSARGKYQNDAYRFFFSPRERGELEAWCDTAGFDPDYIREQARKVHENGLPEWRARPGKGKRYEERKRYNQKQKAHPQ